MNRKELWEMHDKLEFLRLKKENIGLNEAEDLELRNLEVKFMEEWSRQNEF